MEKNAKFVVRLDQSQRGRLQEMVDRGQGAKTIRNQALILLKADEGQRGPAWTDAKIADRREGGVAIRGNRVGTRSQHRQVSRRLAVHDLRRPRKTQTPLPVNPGRM